MTAKAHIASSAGFWLRLVLFLLFPMLYDEMPAGAAAAVCIALVVASLLIELICGLTLWCSAHPLAWLIYMGFEAAIWWSLTPTGLSKGPFMIASFVLLLALSSDAISNSQRWKILVPVSVVFWLLSIVTRPNLNPPSQGIDALILPLPLMIYMLLPSLASLSRLLFPRTKHLIHTSLDYRLVRVEILSMGMKRVAAAGIRRKSASPL